MKINTQKGFIIPLIGGIVALLIAGGVYWVWHSNKGPVVSDAQNNDVMASSSQETIKLISPNGGETLLSGSTVNVSWSSLIFDLSKLVNIELVRQDENESLPIAENIQNTGNYQWTVPTIKNATSDMRWKIVITIGPMALDNPDSSASESSFTIVSTASTASTSDWKTYTNSLYGFSLSVPSSVVTEASSSTVYINDIPLVTVINPNEEVSKSISVFISPGYCSYVPEDEIYASNGVNIDGVDFTFPGWSNSIDDSAQTWKLVESYYGIANNKCYDITGTISGHGASIDTGTQQKEEQDIENIIATFKFTN